MSIADRIAVKACSLLKEIPNVAPGKMLETEISHRCGYGSRFRNRVALRLGIGSILDAVLKTGFTPDEIAKIGGGNFLRIFGEVVRR